MTVEEMIQRGIEAGAPFPDLYDWTWGEINDFVLCKQRARREVLKDQALMDFHHAAIVAKMIGAEKGTKISVVDEYSFLWTKEEAQEIKARQRHAGFAPKKIITPEEQSDYLEAIARERGWIE